MNKEKIIELYLLGWEEMKDSVKLLPLEEKIEVLNFIKKELHEISPFGSEPVDCVLWVKNESVQANDYNPNSVAKPEMELLETSIQADGYTQPIVAWKNKEEIEVVDGFHRSIVGKNNETIKGRIHGYLPVVLVNKESEEKSSRIASTIRHNRARGTHSIDLMSNIVGELTKAGMSDAWILKHIGMDRDELLRLKQITGLADLFKDKDFSISHD
jgi:ParB-like chromosome segregation protein Spo0J